MNQRERFLAALQSRPVDRTPLWMMRQAGRYLPEYQALKAKHGFLKMVQTPELATEVTLQPIQRFGFDAAIFFCDILVIPEAIGQAYGFRDIGGIEMEYAIERAEQIEKLRPEGVREKLTYAADALSLLKKELNGETALIGFVGSPWTLATYMVEGGSSKNFQKIKEFFFAEPRLFEQLLEKVTTAVSEFVEMQIEAGAEAIQIFDSWGGLCSGSSYEPASLKWIRRIVDRVAGRVPVILFAKGLHWRADEFASTGVSGISVDWSANIGQLRTDVPTNLALQGNLDPVLLTTTPEIVRREATRILDEIDGRPGHIFNLGHGITPDAKIPCVEALVETVQSRRFD